MAVSATLSSIAGREEPGSPATPAEVRAYISDMLSQLADLARIGGEGRLEGALRLLALDAAVTARAAAPS